MKISELTSKDGYYEDFSVGTIIQHARGKTVTEMDNVLLTNIVMNTAQGHFNEDVMSKSARGIFGQRVVFGGINLSIVIGLSAQDTAEHCLRELGMDKIRLINPVFHGDTLYAFTEVLEKKDSERVDAGVVRFRHFGINQNDKLCVDAERIVLMKRKSHWAQK